MYSIQVAQNKVSGGHFVNTVLTYRVRNQPGIILPGSAITVFCRTVFCYVISGFRSQYSDSYVNKFYLQQSDWLYPYVLKKRWGWGTLVEPKASQSIKTRLSCIMSSYHSHQHSIVVCFFRLSSGHLRVRPDLFYESGIQFLAAAAPGDTSASSTINIQRNGSPHSIT